MSAVWYVRTKEGDSGPFSLDALLAKVKRGEVQLDDRARRDGEVWQAVRRVMIDFEKPSSAPMTPPPPELKTAPPTPVPIPIAAPSVVPIAVTKPSESSTAAAPKPTVVVNPTNVAAPVRRTWSPPVASKAARSSVASRAISRTAMIRIGGAIAVVAVVWFGIAKFRGDPTFPAPVAVSLEVSPEMQAARNKQLLASREKTRSIAGLKTGVPVLVPGLEDWKTAYSMTLTADLKTIVFASLGHPGTLYDLYLAERTSPASRFDTPKIIESCISPETDAYPTLSADGLSLIYTQSDSAPVLYHARRTARDQPFGKAEIWEPAMKLSVGGYITYPQHLDRDRAAFSFTKGGIANRKLLAIGRPDLATSSDQAEPILVLDTSAPYFFAKSELRAYYSSIKGVEFVYRTRKDESFSAGESLLSADKIGPTEGSVWVTPSEDVLFFCGPGVGGELAVVRQLWMVQF